MDTKASNRIGELRKARGLTQEDLGAGMSSDLTGSTIAKLENGRQKLTVDYAQDIARVLGVSITELLGIDDAGVRVIAIVDQIGSGGWQQAVKMSERTIAVPGSLRGRDIFAIKAIDNSMDKVVAKGGFVVVDPGDTDLVAGKIYMVMDALQQSTCMKFSIDPLQMEPCANDTAREPIRIGLEPFTVIGRVIYSGQQHE
jgi:transcriptional regulator with XRE-family HTH domain